MKVLCALFTFQEEQNILAVIEALRNYFRHSPHAISIAIFDGRSKDRTVDLAQKHFPEIPTVVDVIKLGGSTAMRTAFIYAKLHNYDCMFQFDGDGQHVPEQLPLILGPLQTGEADYVIGSRFLGTSQNRSTWVRRIGIRLFSRLVSLIIGQPITDITSGFRAWNQLSIEFFAEHFSFFYPSIPPLLQAHYHGLRIREVPVVMRDRQHGVSEFGFKKSLEFPIKNAVILIGTMLKRAQWRQP